jgi:hypothetical protein
MPGDTPHHPGAQDSEAARLEAALDRIARSAARRPAPKPADTAAIASKLDQLIADLRGLLGT